MCGSLYKCDLNAKYNDAGNFVILGNAFCFLSSFPWSVLFFSLSFVPSFSNLFCAP